MNTAMLEKLVRFQQPEQLLPFAPQLSSEAAASIFGATVTDYRLALEALERRRTDAATRIAGTPLFETRLARVPFHPGAHLVALGESTTADRLSWFEILRVVLETHRPDLRLRFTNLAVSGATTTQVLAKLPNIRRQAADWIFCLLGTNDSQRFDTPDGPLLVSRDESLRNLAELRTRSFTHADASWVWLTPLLVDEDRIAAFPFFGGSGISWKNADLHEIARSLPVMNDRVVDGSETVTGVGPNAFADDGLHLSIDAHERSTVQLLESLTTQEQP